MRICPHCGVHSDPPHAYDPDTIREVIDATAARTGLTAAGVITSQSRPACRARAAAAAVLRHRLDLSYTDLGRIFDRDHTTMLAAVDGHDQDLAATVEADLEQVTA